MPFTGFSIAVVSFILVNSKALLAPSICKAILLFKKIEDPITTPAAFTTLCDFILRSIAAVWLPMLSPKDWALRDLTKHKKMSINMPASILVTFNRYG